MKSNIKLYRKILPTIVAFFTKKDRYFPEYEWSNEIWTHNLFVIWDQIWGKEFGIKAESTASTHSKNGKNVTKYSFFTVEALVTNMEGFLRQYFKKKIPKFKFVPVQQFQPVLAGSNMKIPIFTFAIAFDVVGNDYEYNTSTTGCTFNLTAGAAASIAVMFLAYNPAGVGPAWISSVKVNGSTTGVTAIDVPWNYSGTQWFNAYYLVDPPTSSVAYLCTTTTFAADKDVEMVAEILSGAAQTGQVDSFATGSGTSTATLTTTVVASNCWLCSIGRNTTNGAVTASTGTTNRRTGTSCNIGDSNGTVGTGSQSMAWTSGSGTTYGRVVSIAPVAAASGPTNLKSLDTNVKSNIKSYNTNVLANIKSINTNT